MRPWFLWLLIGGILSLIIWLYLIKLAAGA